MNSPASVCNIRNDFRLFCSASPVKVNRSMLRAATVACHHITSAKHIGYNATEITKAPHNFRTTLNMLRLYYFQPPLHCTVCWNTSWSPSWDTFSRSRKTARGSRNAESIRDHRFSLPAPMCQRHTDLLGASIVRRLFHEKMRRLGCCRMRWLDLDDRLLLSL